MKRSSSLLLLMLSGSVGHAQDFFYTGADGGIFHDSFNWSPGIVPTLGSTAWIWEGVVFVNQPLSLNHLKLGSSLRVTPNNANFTFEKENSVFPSLSVDSVGSSQGLVALTYNHFGTAVVSLEKVNFQEHWNVLEKRFHSLQTDNILTVSKTSKDSRKFGKELTSIEGQLRLDQNLFDWMTETGDVNSIPRNVATLNIKSEITDNVRNHEGVFASNSGSIVYEGFNYSENLSSFGLNGGIGWAGSWKNDSQYPSGTVINPSIIFPGLHTNGGRVTNKVGGSVRINRDILTNPILFGGNGKFGTGQNIIYTSFLFQAYTQGGNFSSNLFGTGISFQNSSTSLQGNMFLGVGVGNRVRIITSGGAFSTGSVEVQLGTPMRFVAKFDFINSRTLFWVNPTLETAEPLNPTGFLNSVPLVPIENVAVHLFGFQSSVDEIIVGSTFSSVTPVPDYQFALSGLLCIYILVGLFRVKIHA